VCGQRASDRCTEDYVPIPVGGSHFFSLFHARNMLNIPSFLISSSSLTKLLSFCVYHPTQNLKELRHGQSILPKKIGKFFSSLSFIIHLNLPEL